LDGISDDGQDVGDEDYVSGDECNDDNDQILSHEMQGAYSSGSAMRIKTAPRTNDAPRSEHDAALVILSSFCYTLYLSSLWHRINYLHQVGKEVILYALLKSDQTVGKGTIISTKPSTVLGNQPLGREFCEVVVTFVLKRDAVLPRPYTDMETMADVKMMSIACPYQKVRN
jgi:hypothetical protein